MYRKILNWLLRLASTLKLKIVKKTKYQYCFSNNLYEPIMPYATYSPWNVDENFKNIYFEISNLTLVDKYRCYELWKLVEQSAKLENGCIIEIGVWRGGTGALLAKQAISCNIPDCVYLCDTFTGVVKASDRDSNYIGGEHADTSRAYVEEVLNKLHLNNVEILEGIFPEQTGRCLENVKFRFCHIDVDVYKSAKDIVEWIWDRMVPGGIIVFDDFGFSTCNGIATYIEEQLYEKDKLIIQNLNGHAIIIKL